MSFKKELLAVPQEIISNFSKILKAVYSFVL